MKAGDTISKDGDRWTIVSLGVLVDGRRFAHLASTTRFVDQRNGRRPVQRGDWLEEKGK